MRQPDKAICLTNRRSLLVIPSLGGKEIERGHATTGQAQFQDEDHPPVMVPQLSVSCAAESSTRLLIAVGRFLCDGMS